MAQVKKLVTCTAPVNIAVIKYWGKRDEKLILPINDSISLTLSSDEMHAKTTVAASTDFPNDQIWLNGVEESMENPRLVNCLREVRKRARNSNLAGCKLRICSENNFPTAAGLASSAAGYACLVYALCKLYDVEGDISELARQGSGSACRSVYGGFVHWVMGSNPDGSDSLARVVKPREHWPEMRVIILVANDARKKVSSSLGMRTSVETSDLLKYRAEKLVPQAVKKMIEAINARDFQSFAEITIRDSNQMHATCLDTYPPCVYMNATSHFASELVHKINQIKGKSMLCYTFDAGPNACLFLPRENVPLISKILEHFFKPESEKLFRGAEFDFTSDEISRAESEFSEILPKMGLEPLTSGLKYAIYTKVGSGPQVLESETDHLLDSNGNPKNLK